MHTNKEIGDFGSELRCVSMILKLRRNWACIWPCVYWCHLHLGICNYHGYYHISDWHLSTYERERMININMRVEGMIFWTLKMSTIALIVMLSMTLKQWYTFLKYRTLSDFNSLKSAVSSCGVLHISRTHPDLLWSGPFRRNFINNFF